MQKYGIQNQHKLHQNKCLRQSYNQEYRQKNELYPRKYIAYYNPQFELHFYNNIAQVKNQKMPIQVEQLVKEDKKCRGGNDDRTFIYVHRHRKLISRKRDNFIGQKRNGIWTLAETRRYIEFLRGHVDVFSDKQSRRNHKIFVFMAKFIKTRSAIQCRSHHQKMINRHQKIGSVIDHYDKKAIPAYLYRHKVLKINKSELSCRKKFYTIKIIKNEIKINIKQEYIECYEF